MITKPAISFINSSSNPDLVTKVNTITDAMTDNPNYPGQQSGIADVVTLNTAFQAAITAAADGGKLARADPVTKRAALVDRVRILALYVQMHCNKNMDILLSSGFPVQKPTRTAATLLSTPMVQTIKPGMLTGTVTFK